MKELPKEYAGLSNSAITYYDQLNPQWLVVH